ncbi:MAG: zinc ribbon domain-containing protein [Candidatus Heimdallarchaeota archaeon]|nr:zinc ribbon domain-containing protein [Candidatus Heimdallarchaeota archaeon]
MSSKSCPHCNHMQSNIARFCENCGGDLSVQDNQTQMTNYKSLLPQTRGYLLWGILYVIMIVLEGLLLNSLFFFNSILGAVFGIPYTIYIYYNFKDMNHLHEVTHQKKPLPIILLVLLYFFFGILPITIFFKYQQLRIHLKNDHRGESVLPPDPWVVVLFLILTGISFSFIIPILVMTMSVNLIGFIVNIASIIRMIGFLAFEAQWQKSLNTHIENHSLAFS